MIYMCIYIYIYTHAFASKDPTSIPRGPSCAARAARPSFCHPGYSVCEFSARRTFPRSIVNTSPTKETLAVRDRGEGLQVRNVNVDAGMLQEAFHP